jgi:predicted nuclease of predicted toxin-antitoxin system
VKLVVDMNLSPDWVPLLQQHHFEALHWSSIGAGTAEDTEIMQWARDHDSVVFTHDLDFGIILALTHAGTPSVIQTRTQNVSPVYLGPKVLSVLQNHGEALIRGALITIDDGKSRVRILPIEPKQDD